MNYSIQTNHLHEVSETLGTIRMRDMQAMASVIKNASMTYVIGNGGSAATASHFAADLSKAAGLPVMSLDNMAAVTAWGNDEGFVNSFSQQLQRLQRGDNEVLVAISTSGNSQNVLEAVEIFKGTVVALTGDIGGHLASRGNVAFHIEVKAKAIEVVEDCHSAICHAVVRMLKGGDGNQKNSPDLIARRCEPVFYGDLIEAMMEWNIVRLSKLLDGMDTIQLDALRVALVGLETNVEDKLKSKIGEKKRRYEEAIEQ